MKRRLSTAVFLAVAGTLLVVPSSQALTANPVWKCRASASYVSLSGNPRVEPLAANGNLTGEPDNLQCADAEVGAGTLLTPLGIPLATLGLQTASARTKVTPELGQAINQTVNAAARIEGLNLGTLLTLNAASSSATGSCSGTTPVLSGTSNVLGLNQTNLDPVVQAIANLLSVAPNLISLKINEQVRTPDSLTVRAAHLKVLSGNGPPLIDLVIAESKVGFSGAVCDPSAQPPIGACPAGSTYDIDNNVCIIPGSSGSVFGIIIIGRPFQGPSGGTVVPIDIARKKFGNGPCLRGNRSPRFAIIGTSKNDRITGTNKADRVLARSGNDSVSGGRGNDCLEGNNGRDKLSGSIGTDRIFGQKGRDALNGASGNDRLSGGSGRDSINAGYGADRVFGGSGRDSINVATAGRRARVSCGSGRDKVRVNFVERRRTRGCEVIYVFSDKFRR